MAFQTQSPFFGRKPIGDGHYNLWHTFSRRNADSSVGGHVILIQPQPSRINPSEYAIAVGIIKAARSVNSGAHGIAEYFSNLSSDGALIHPFRQLFSRLFAFRVTVYQVILTVTQ